MILESNGQDLNLKSQIELYLYSVNRENENEEGTSLHISIVLLLIDILGHSFTGRCITVLWLIKSERNLNSIWMMCLSKRLWSQTL